MSKCAYPPCRVMIESGGESPPAFCEKHLLQKCLFPPCKEMVIPNSGWCQEHNDWVNLFDFVHTIRHQEAMQRQIEAQRNAAIVQQVMGKGKGNGNQGGLIIKGR